MTALRPVLAITTLSLFAVTAACASELEDDGPPSPMSGHWTYEDLGIEENTCGTEDVAGESDTTFELTDNGDGTFTIAQDTYGDFDCTQTGSTFECPDRLAGDFAVSGTDMVLTWHVSITGDVHSATHVSGAQRYDIVDCEGTDCASLPIIGVELPCYYTSGFDAEAHPM